MTRWSRSFLVEYVVLSSLIFIALHSFPSALSTTPKIYTPPPVYLSFTTTVSLQQPVCVGAPGAPGAPASAPWAAPTAAPTGPPANPPNAPPANAPSSSTPSAPWAGPAAPPAGSGSNSSAPSAPGSGAPMSAPSAGAGSAPGVSPAALSCVETTWATIATGTTGVLDGTFSCARIQVNGANFSIAPLSENIGLPVPYDVVQRSCNSNSVRVRVYSGNECVVNKLWNTSPDANTRLKVPSSAGLPTDAMWTWGCTRTAYSGDRDVAQGILNPPALRVNQWLSAKPMQTVAGATTVYELSGFRSFYVAHTASAVEKFFLKASAGTVDCKGLAPGSAVAPVDASGRAALTITTAGSYRLCVKNRNDFEPLDFLLKVDAPNTNAIFAGANTCKGYLDINPNYCGCFFKRVVGAVSSAAYNVRSDLPLHRLQGSASSFTANMGCCAQRTQVRQEYSVGDTDVWGYCSN